MRAVKAAPWILALVLLAAVGWLVLSGGGQNAEEAAADAEAPLAQPEAGALAAGSADLQREASPDPAAEELGAHAVIGSVLPGEPDPIAWFRGQLRIVGGELPTPPILTAVVEPAERGDSVVREVRLDPRELTFAVPAHHLDANCRLQFGDLIRPVRSFGSAALDGNDVLFAAPAEGVIIEVEVKPHAGVRFLHDPSGEPLARAHAWHRVEDSGASSATYSSVLDADGMMFFDFERLADVGGAESVTFSVSRPPDVGYSESAHFPVQEFLNLPRPVVLRFGATERLRFRVVDGARNPIPGASVRIGNGRATEVADAQGWFSALQSSPPEENVVAQAPGFITSTLPITAAARTGQELELQIASRVVVTGTEPPPGGWGQLDAEFTFTGKADSTTLLPSNFMPGRFAENGGGTGITSHSDELRFILGTSFSHQGRVVVDGIHVDVPVRVIVRYRGFTVLDERVPLQPGDGEHAVQVGPLPALVPLTGIAEDASGAPLAGVTVTASSGSWEQEAVSGEAGRFDLGVVAVGSTTQVKLRLSGYGIQQVEHVAEAADTDSVGRIRLTTGRSVILQILGPDGAPYVAQPGTFGASARPVLQVFGGQVRPEEHPAVALGAGEWIFTDLPAGTFRCFIQSDWIEVVQTIELDTTQPRATLNIGQLDLDRMNSKE